MKLLRLFGLLLMSGCTVLGIDYRRPAMDLPAAFPVQPSGAAQALNPSWWTLYGDPILDDLVASARVNNADLRIAAAQVLEAEAVLRQLGAAGYPDLALGGSRGRSRVSRLTVPPPAAGASLELSDTRAALTTSFEIDLWGRLERSTEAARANLLASHYAREVVALSLSGLTAQAYFSLRSLDAQLTVLERSINARRESVALARARLAAGLAPELDLHQAQSALFDALVQRRDIARQRALTERQLGQLTGRPGLALGDRNFFGLPVPPTPPPGMPSALLERRPDIRAAEQSLVAANAQLGVAKAALFPAVALTGALGTQSAAFSNLLAGGAGIWSLGFALSLPIFDGGRREALTDQARARRLQSLGAYQRSVEAGFREVSDALVNLEQAGASEADLSDRLSASREALRLAVDRYEAGYSPYLEVLDAQRGANEAELAFVRNRQARLAFSVDLMKSLGGGWIPEP
ncbi:MAG: efflux transporter outer membrane subunit [Proteobacteria bacterium]|nr:efflux transporter outer membrane subunit [Pseudomonadota bacterium]